MNITTNIQARGKEGDFFPCANLEKNKAKVGPHQIQTQIKTKQSTAESISVPQQKTQRAVSISPRYQCSECEKNFADKKTLIRHQKQHTVGGSIFPCGKCNKVLKRQDRLGEHYITCSTQICAYCDLHIADKNQFRVHVIHHQLQPHRCPQCNKEYKSKQRLNIHQKTHTRSKKTYPCEMCNKTFSASSGLKRHQSIHQTRLSKDKIAYWCAVCDFSCGEKNLLIEHSKKHKEGDVYKCKICEKEIKSFNNRKRHFMTHMREKKFSALTVNILSNIKVK